MISSTTPQTSPSPSPDPDHQANGQSAAACNGEASHLAGRSGPPAPTGSQRQLSEFSMAFNGVSNGSSGATAATGAAAAPAEARSSSSNSSNNNYYYYNDDDYAIQSPSYNYPGSLPAPFQLCAPDPTAYQDSLSPSPHHHRTILTVHQSLPPPTTEQLDQRPLRTWPQDVWLHGPGYRVLYQPVLVLSQPRSDGGRPIDGTLVGEELAEATTEPLPSPVYEANNYSTDDPLSEVVDVRRGPGVQYNL